MKIATYNVNGIRAALKKGLLDWIAEEQPDVLLLQETKIHTGQIDTGIFDELGYYSYWNYADKKGYSGVATLTKKAPLSVSCSMDIDAYDNEGRSLLADYGDFSILNVYIPSGSSGEGRQAFKMQFLSDFSDYLEALRKQAGTLIIGGDFNIVHTRLDIHNPDRKDNPSGYRPEERAWMDGLCETGLIDSFRYLHPGEIEFSWWSYRARSRERNKGWRIDYLCITPDLAPKLISARHASEARQSDHCPVVVEFQGL